MLRRILAVLAPAAVLLLLTLLLQPLDLGYLAFMMVVAALTLGAAGGFLIRPEPEEPEEPDSNGWLVILALLSAVITAVFWFRLWQYDGWDLVSIPVKFLYVAGFWWPGVFLGALAWTLAGPFVFRSLRRYGVVLAVGLAASTVGAAAYQTAYLTYYKAHDGQNLSLAMERLAAKVPGTMTWQHRRGILTVSVDCNWAAEAPPYTVISSLAGVAETAIRQLHRADVSEVNVQVTANGLLLFTGDATDDAPAAPADWLQRLDRSNLKDNGRLDQASLDEMAALEPGELPTAVEQEDFAKTFRYGLNGSEVFVTFEAPESVSIDNVGRHVVAYRLANRIVTETAAYFPEIETFRVTMAGNERVVASKSVAPKSFCLQADLLPSDKVLGLVIRNQGVGSASLDAASFQPDVPLTENQLAIVAVNGKLTSQTAGRLYQPIEMESSNVIITAVGEDGTATAFAFPKDPSEVPSGPVVIAPGTEEVAAGQWILNAGLQDRVAFTQ